MSTILIVLAAMLAGALVAGWLYRRRIQRRYRLPFLTAFAGATTRKLTQDERDAVENYLEILNRTQLTPGPTGATAAPVALKLNAQSDTVLCVTRSITRYGITTDDPNKWRYYLDSVEVHLPPSWEQYINDENSVELIHTDSLPLVITLNDHTLNEYLQEAFKDYKLIFHERSVSDYGNSQVSRKRLVIIGVHKKTGKKYLNAFNEVFQVKTPTITRELLFESPYGSNYNIPIEKTLAMYDYRKLPEKKNLTVRKIQLLWNSDFKNEKKWPIKTAKMSTLPGVYRLELDKAPLTLRPADRQFRPDGYPLGILDFKAIMGFPKAYKIFMDEGNYLYWLNKARYTIAKGSVYEISIWFKRCIKKIS